MRVRPAGPDDHLPVVRVLDAAMLETDAAELRTRIDAGDVFVAEADGRVLGTAVLEPGEDGAHLESIAVRRARRGQGIGSALVGRARERHGTLTAECDPDLRPFYESLGFELEPAEDGRLRGTTESEH